MLKIILSMLKNHCAHLKFEKNSNVLSALNMFEFFANFKCPQCFLSMLNMILSILKKLSMLKKFEYA